MEAPDLTPVDILTPAERKKQRLEDEEKAEIQGANRARNARKRAEHSRERYDERAQLYNTRWDFFLMDGVSEEQRRLLFCILDQRPTQPSTTPADITGNFVSARRSLQQFIKGGMFPEEIPEGIAPKVTAIRSTALTKWKNIRTRTAKVDQPVRQKAHGLQDTDREQLILKRRSARNHKKRERIRRLHERTNEIRQLVKALSIAISSDEDLRAARDSKERANIATQRIEERSHS